MFLNITFIINSGVLISFSFGGLYNHVSIMSTIIKYQLSSFSSKFILSSLFRIHEAMDFKTDFFSVFKVILNQFAQFNMSTLALRWNSSKNLSLFISTLPTPVRLTLDERSPYRGSLWNRFPIMLLGFQFFLFALSLSPYGKMVLNVLIQKSSLSNLYDRMSSSISPFCR